MQWGRKHVCFFGFTWKKNESVKRERVCLGFCDCRPIQTHKRREEEWVCCVQRKGCNWKWKRRGRGRGRYGNFILCDVGPGVLVGPRLTGLVCGPSIVFRCYFYRRIGAQWGPHVNSLSFLYYYKYSTSILFF